jgi:hypothetical protein
MKIDDRRVTTSWVPAVQILEQVIPLMKHEHFAGIRSIVLLDTDYHANRQVAKASGRYCPIQGTRAADIEMYFAHFSSLPEEVKANPMVLTYFITETLMHEVYHHVVRAHQKVKRPSFKEEQKAAQRWAFAAICHVARQLFPGQEAEWERLEQFFKQTNAPVR